MAEISPQNRTPAGKPRPPIVVVMGHVDHGKTTLLDRIRKSNMAEREAGGITQSIGAYEIEVPLKAEPKSRENEADQGIPRQPRDDSPEIRRITFIDTPGHEAFTRMRSRGANAADLAILVVAADEGVKPQTTESIRILDETKTPFVVALTKTDKPNADPERVKNELTSAGVLLEGYGGSVSYEPVSAKTGEHVSELLDLLLLTAEMENLVYDPTLAGTGFVLETRMDRRRGLEASVIVKNGTLKRGEPIATPTGKGKIKIMENFLGETALALEPSAPALIIGWEELPQVGEEFVTGPEANVDLAKRPESRLATPPAAPGLPVIPDDTETLNFILKASDAGSLEALSEIVKAMIADKPAKLIAASVGDVTDNDVKLGISTKSILISFKGKVDRAAGALAEANRVKIISSEIIYDLVKAVEDFLTQKEGAGSIAELEILAVFNQPKPEKQVVGGRVVRGVFRNKALFDIERQGAVAGQGRVSNLQQQKKDAREVAEGSEAGLMANSQILIQVGDKLIIKS